MSLQRSTRPVRARRDLSVLPLRTPRALDPCFKTTCRTCQSSWIDNEIPSLRQLFADASGVACVVASCRHPSPPPESRFLPTTRYGSIVAVRYSSAARLLKDIPNELQEVHRTDPTKTDPTERTEAKAGPEGALWDGWETAGPPVDAGTLDSDDDDVDLTEMGF